MTAVLGVHLGPAHDTGAALVYEADGELRAVAIAEARLSRRKHSREFPHLAIQACLDEVGLQLSELDAVCVEKNTPTPGPRWIDPLDPASPGWPTEADPAEAEFLRALVGVRFARVNHHLAHAATAWHTTKWPEDEQPGAVLVLDGRGTLWHDDTPDNVPSHCSFPRNQDLYVPDDRAPSDRRLLRIPFRGETQTIFSARGRTLTREAVSLRPGVGFFYSWLTQMVLGFAHMHAGKSMGLAAYGDPDSNRYPRLPDDLLQGVDTDYVNYIREHCNAGLDFPLRTEEPPTDPRFADAAAWGQRELTRAVEHLVRQALASTGARRLGYAGGVALNVVANREVRDTMRREGTLDEMFIQPAASDEGLALGAALLGYYTLLEKTLPFQQEQARLGPTSSALALGSGLRAARGARVPYLPERAADLLLDGKILGWAQGRSEHGPRALGARSILCWPRPGWMKDHINARVKHREAFRPFAPVALEEHATEAFDLSEPSPFMLMNAHVRPDYRDRLPAITHSDGSARLQTISGEEAPELAELLREIHRRDGVGVLLNTSFNDNNEPIVETAEHAHDCFKRTGLDALVCGETILLAQPEASTQRQTTNIADA